jgi:hypothetical protein
MYDYCTRVYEYECLVTSFVFNIVDILGLAAPDWFFSSQIFHFVTNILSSLNSAFKIFFCTQTHSLGSVRSQYLFSIMIPKKLARGMIELDPRGGLFWRIY